MDELEKSKIDLIYEQNHLSMMKVDLITIILSFVLFISLTGQSIVIPVFPLYVKVFGGGTFQLGLLIGIYSLTSLIFSPILGSWADKFGRKIFIVLGLLGFAIANLLYSQAQTFNQLLLFRIVEGSTAAGTGAIVNALLIDIIPSNKRGRYLGFANGSGFLGVFIGPFFGGILVQYGSITLPFIASAVIALFGMIVAILILPNDYSKFRHKHHTKKITKEPLLDRLNFTNWLIQGTTTVFIVLIFIRLAGNSAWTLIQPVVPIYLYALAYTPVDVGVFFGFFGIAVFLGQIFLGGLSDKYGRKTVLQIGLGIYFLGYFTMANATNLIIFFLSAILDGVGLSLIVPAIVAFLADLTTNEVHRGKVMGVYYDAFFLAGIVGPILGGYLGAVFGFNFVLGISLLIILLAISMSFFLKTIKQDPFVDYGIDQSSIQSVNKSSAND